MIDSKSNGSISRTSVFGDAARDPVETAKRAPIRTGLRPKGVAHTSLLVLAMLIWAAVPTIGQETLPTPYTAEQIRDAWTPGFAVWTSVTTNEGTQRSVTTVASWSSARANVCERPTDENERPTGPKQCSDVTWEELRSHASFPAAAASRSRATRTTPLGELEGWLYEVTREGGSIEFFFADSTPGPPATMRHFNQGKPVLEMVQTKRRAGKDAGR